MSEELLTVSEAAKKLGVSARTIQRYCKQGFLNYKWVHGQRHRELRVVPPIPVSLLPGVNRGSVPGDEKLVSREELESMIGALTREIRERDRRIEALEQESARISREGAATKGEETALFDQRRVEKLEALIGEYERVRPVEKKLILKLAQTVKEQGDFLRTLGMKSK